METFKVILHTDGDDKCLRNVVNYPIGKDQLLKEGFGIDPNNSRNAFQQFKRIAEFHNNQDKTPVFHYIASLTEKTAPTAERAMELAKEIFEPITESHLAAIGTHFKKREDCSYHNHVAVSPTNFNDGSMLYADNKTNFALAQRMADVTGKPTQLIVRKEDESEWKCPKIFIPQDDEE